MTTESVLLIGCRVCEHTAALVLIPLVQCFLTDFCARRVSSEDASTIGSPDLMRAEEQ